MAVTLWAHVPCLKIWRWESATFAPSPSNIEMVGQYLLGFSLQAGR